jgi:hypothetical protein
MVGYLLIVADVVLAVFILKHILRIVRFEVADDISLEQWRKAERQSEILFLLAFILFVTASITASIICIKKLSPCVECINN